MDPFLASETAEHASTFSHLAHLWPEFLLAWAGWMIHSLVHSAGHVVRVALRRGAALIIGYLKSL